MQLIHSLDDPRVALYRNLRERNLRSEGLFITEGALLAERLLKSRFVVESLLVTTENAERFGQLLQNSRHPQAALYTAPATLIRDIVGFDFHRGVLGIGRRTPFPAVRELVTHTLENFFERAHFLVCPATETAENLGLILRSAAAFEVAGVLLSATAADPLSRRCLRQSMGHALALPIATSQTLRDDLSSLQNSHGLILVAAVANGDGVKSINNFAFPQRMALLMGHEYEGLDEKWLAQCDHRVTIPLAPSCDSLNVAVATGIFLHHMRN